MDGHFVLQLGGAFLAAFLAGAINSVAGGGTMISFPILLALGLPPLIANATNTVGIWPGSLGSIWGFRQELARVPKFYRWLMIPALIGGAFGAVLLRHTSSEAFEHIVPWLLIFATILFIIQAPVRERLLKSLGTESGRSRAAIIAAVALQLLVSVYGGYFGAGMSILMLTALGIMGLTDMLEMTAMTSFLSIAINGIAGVIFAFSGLVYWPYIAVMAIGAVVGGYGAAGVARKVGKVAIRRLVIFVGITLSIVMFVKILR